MKILLVEDNTGFAGDLEHALQEVHGMGEIVKSGDKETSINHLKNNLFDLVILDLSIPPSPYVEVADPEHGQAVFHEARELHPGTPIFVLTGSEIDKFSRSLARLGNQVKLWGEKAPVETLNYFRKEEVDELLSRVATMCTAVANMSNIAINTRGKDLGLTPVQLRMLKTFTKSLDCVASDVSLLSGGLSDAKVVKITAVDQNRRAQALCAAKLGHRRIISAERDAYDKHVRKLTVGACPPLFDVVEDGVGLNGSIFYTLTDSDTKSLFDRLSENPDLGIRVVHHIRHALSRWTEASAVQMITVREIRERMLAEEKMQELAARFDLSGFSDIENLKLQASASCIHGDLHCGNVLVKSSGESVLIDFGDAGPGFTGIDPITLELSLLFHPDSKKSTFREELVSNLDRWPDVENFAGNIALKSMIIACRDWAYDVAGGDMAVLAIAYAYALRQLKYETVPSELTLAFIERLAVRLRAG